MHRRNAMQRRIDLWNKRTQMELFRELPGIEISHRRRLNFLRIDVRVVDRLLAGFGNEVPDGFAFLLQVALKVSSAATDDVYGFHRSGLFTPREGCCHAAAGAQLSRRTPRGR